MKFALALNVMTVVLLLMLIIALCIEKQLPKKK